MLRIEEAQHFAERLGIVSVFSDKMVPSLATAIYTNDLPNQFEANQRVWDFAHSLMSEKKIYYGRLLKPRNTLISMKLLPCFIKAYTIPDYRKLYRAGVLSKIAKSIMELLIESQPLMTIQIKERLRFFKKMHKKALENALKELQENFLICCSGKIAHCKCRWRFSLWAPTLKWIPDTVQSKAEQLNREVAMCRIIEKFVYTTVLTNERTIAQFFAWPLNEVRTVVKSMLKKGLISYRYSRKGLSLFKGNL